MRRWKNMGFGNSVFVATLHSKRNAEINPMIKKFHIIIPLSFKETFGLLSKSGDQILSWNQFKSDFDNGYIAWKQAFWSLTGHAAITASLTTTREKETSVVIEVHKPLQILDPVKLCDMVFRKFDRILKKNLIDIQNPHG
jgi:hypothetical protein